MSNQKVGIVMEKVGCYFFKVHLGNQKKQKKQKQVLMLAKFDVEKVSATACQALEKKNQEKSVAENKTYYTFIVQITN